MKRKINITSLWVRELVSLIKGLVYARLDRNPGAASFLIGDLLLPESG